MLKTLSAAKHANLEPVLRDVRRWTRTFGCSTGGSV